MKLPIVLVVLALAAGSAFAQGAEQYCESERADGEACYQGCCESLGYSWAGVGCDVPDSDTDYVAASCSFCTDSYVQCVEAYGQQPSGGYSDYSNGSGCCASFILPALLCVSALFRMR